MTVEKLSVSLDAALAREVRREAKRAKMSVSAWLAQAAVREAKLATARRVIADWEAENGPITDEELEEVRRIWPDSRSTPAPSSRRSATTGESGRTRSKRRVAAS